MACAAPPPLIPGRPVVGYLPEYRKDAAKLFLDMAERGGDIARFRIGPRVVTLLNRPDLILHVLKTKWRDYPKSENYDEVSLLLGGNLAISDGDDWARFRKRAQSALSRKNFGDLSQVTAESITQMLPASDGIVDVYELGMQLSARISSRLLFGSDIRAEAEGLEKVLRAGFAFVSARIEMMVRLPVSWPLPSHWRFRRDVAQVEALVSDLIERARRGSATGAGMLHHLVTEADQDGGNQAEINRDVLTEAVFLYIGSFETTGASFAWVLHLLATHPETRAAVEAEIDAALGDGPVDLEALGNLPLLGAVIQETLRLYPTIWLMSRTAKAPDEIDGYWIEAGSMVMISPYVLHRRADLWPDPCDFRPERFLEGASWPRSAYLPFSIGPHACVGSHLAMVELQMIFAVLLRANRFDLAPGETCAHRSGVTLTPAGGLRMKAVSRRAFG